MPKSQWRKTYFLIMFCSDALRPSKTQNFVLRAERHSPRRRLSTTSFPQAHQTEGSSQQSGRPSYHPLVCFNGITKDYWHREPQPGDAHTAAGVLDFLNTFFVKGPSSVKVIIIRADKGFYDHKTIEYLESEDTLFAIITRLTPPIKRQLAGLSYQHYSSGI